MSNKSPLQRIKEKCLECSAGSPTEVRECPVVDCALYEYRLGKNPYRKPRKYTDEQRAAMGARLARSRGA
jgi:hypothetical protein